jgi:uncharacterized protein DUF6869
MPVSKSSRIWKSRDQAEHEPCTGRAKRRARLKGTAFGSRTYADMTADDRRTLVAAYLAYAESRDDALFWAFEAVSELVYRKKFDDLWLVCLDMIAAVPEGNDAVLAYAAAGPLEDLIGRTGKEFADRIEAVARQNARFRHALTGVWGREEQPELWNRLAPLLSSVPNPL